MGFFHSRKRETYSNVISDIKESREGIERDRITAKCDVGDHMGDIGRGSQMGKNFELRWW
jgi:hypothetical protein